MIQMTGSKLLKNQKINKEMEERTILLLQGALTLLNIVAVCLISGFIYNTTEVIRHNYKARVFLDYVEKVPHNPAESFYLCILLMGALAVSFVVRNRIRKTYSKVVVGTLFFDILVTLAVIWILDFNYNGLLLLVFAEILYYVSNRRIKIVLVAFAVMGFIVTNYDFLSLNLSLYNVKDYIGYYSGNVQQYLMSIYNILFSLGIILFIIYCIFVINSQSNTIEEVNRLYHELQSANEQLREYADMSEQMAKTKERNRLAREIHDTLGHTLTGITAGLDACITTIDISPAQTKEQLRLLTQVSRDGINEVRRSVSELSPDTIERLHLDAAIRKMITDMSCVSGAEILFETNEKQLSFDEDEENAIYRIIQESITNALRHGKASKIRIEMEKVDGEIRLTIRDNGVGCKEIKSGFGIKHIQERAEMLHGRVTFDGREGFTVFAIIPIRWGEKYD